MKLKRYVSHEAWIEPSNFESDDFLDHHVVRSDKTILVMSPFSWFSHRFAKPRSTKKHDSDMLFTSKEDIVVFPKLEHADHFIKALQGLRVAGPSSLNPGAIGTVRLRLYLSKQSQRLALSFAQAHFKTGTGSDLPRPMATYYGGWRKRALTEAVKLAVHVNLPLEVSWSKLYPRDRNYSDVSPLHRELIEVANNLGVKVKETKLRNGRFLIVNPRC